MASSKLLKVILAVAIAFGAGVLGSLTHALGDTRERVEDAGSSKIVNTHDSVEKALQYYIGISGHAGNGIFVVTPEDGKLHFIKFKQEAESVRNLLKQIKRLQHDSCRGNGCSGGGGGGLWDKEEPPPDDQDSKTNVSEASGNGQG